MWFETGLSLEIKGQPVVAEKQLRGRWNSQEMESNETSERRWMREKKRGRERGKEDSWNQIARIVDFITRQLRLGTGGQRHQNKLLAESIRIGLQSYTRRQVSELPAAR